MSPQTWRRAAAAALAGAVMSGALASAPAALAQPAQPGTPMQPGVPVPVVSPGQPGQTIQAGQPGQTAGAGTGAPTTRAVSPDAVLMMIDQQYDTGAGGGQVSKLIAQVMTLRKLGYKPSRANTQALLEGLDKRPNQAPLIGALEATLSTQRKQQMQAGNQIKQPAVAPPATPGIAQAPLGPGGWAPGNPMIQDPNDTIFPMPGRQG
jgi:hypothetical protein